MNILVFGKTGQVARELGMRAGVTCLGRAGQSLLAGDLFHSAVPSALGPGHTRRSMDDQDHRIAGR